MNMIFYHPLEISESLFSTHHFLSDVTYDSSPRPVRHDHLGLRKEQRSCGPGGGRQSPQARRGAGQAWLSLLNWRRAQNELFVLCLSPSSWRSGYQPPPIPRGPPCKHSPLESIWPFQDPRGPQGNTKGRVGKLNGTRETWRMKHTAFLPARLWGRGRCVCARAQVLFSFWEMASQIIRSSGGRESITKAIQQKIRMTFMHSYSGTQV